MSRITLALCIAICVALSGCSSQEEPETAAVAIEGNSEKALAPDQAKEQVEIEQTVEESGPVDVPTDESKTEAEEDLALASDSFEPPFPDRVELFLAPKRAGRGIKKSTDGVDNSVELLGFVNVNGQRVVLSIDGLVSPLAEGSHQAGIEVISIQPPTAVLQRGRQRWQVTLEN